MTPHQIALVQMSFGKVERLGRSAADLFYGRLFDMAPYLRDMFPDDLTDQKRKLMAMLNTVVTNLSNLNGLMPAVRALGQRHAAYGVVDEHYALVGAALLWTLGKGLGEAFTPQVKDAWLGVYATLSRAMIEAAREVPMAA